MTPTDGSQEKANMLAGQPIWPENQVVGRWAGSEILVTRFADHDSFAPALRATVLARSKDPKLAHQFADDGVTKVYDFQKWGTPESDLINARALSMFHRVAKNAKAQVDACWASLYKKGNFVMPHSHVGSIASVLYMLDPGDTSEKSGGEFLFADPRLKPCCRQQNGFMTTPSAPNIVAGTMVIFPGRAVHFVTPYLGKVPRITLSWDLKPKGSPASAVPKFMTRPN